MKTVNSVAAIICAITDETEYKSFNIQNQNQTYTNWSILEKNISWLQIQYDLIIQ